MGDIYLDDAALSVYIGDGSGGEDNDNDNDTQGGSGSNTVPETNPENTTFSNGDFEEFVNNGFKYWSFWKGNRGNTTITQVDGKNGKAAKIVIDNNNNIVNLYQSVKIDPTKRYKLTAFIKTEDMALQWDGANGVYLALSYNNNIVLAKSNSIKEDSDWTKLELIVDGSILKGDEETVQLDIICEYLTGSVYVDSATISETTETPNQSEDEGGSVPEVEDTAPLKNAGFETFKDGAFKYWTFWGGNKGNTTITQADGRTGKAAKLNIDNDGSIVRLYQEVELDPTKEYTFSVWVKTENTALQFASAPGAYVNLALDNAKILASESINTNSNWKKLSVVINGAVLSGEEWSVCFDLAAEYMKGTVYFDDATLEVTGVATPIAKPDEDELLKNNSFEIFSAGNFANWTTWKGNKGNTLFEQVDGGRTGKGVKITVDDDNNIVNLYQEVELDPTKEYTFSVWVKVDDIDLQWAGAQGVYLNFKYNNNVILMSKPVTAKSDWQKLELTVNGGILKGDEWGVSLDIACEYLTGVIYVDDASVKATGVGSPVPEKAKGELLENGNFELYSGYNFARWSLNKGNNGNTLLSQVEGKEGKGAKIVIDDNNNIVSLYQGIKLDPTKEYTFTIWVKAEDIALQWAGAEGIYLALSYNNTTPIRTKAIKEDSDWVKFELKVGGGDIPADAWGVQFALMSEFLTGTIYVDSASMMVTGDYVPRPDSYLVNGSFDLVDSENNLADWTSYAEDIFSVLDRNTDITKGSMASASIFNGNDDVVSYFEQAVLGLDTAKTYLLTGYIKTDGVVTANGGAAIFVEFYDNDSNLIRTFRTEYVTGTADWTQVSIKLAFPENCYKMVVRPALKCALGTAYFDELTLGDFDETTDSETALGTRENLFNVVSVGETVEDGGFKIPVFVWIIAGGVLLLAVSATIVFIVISKKKKVKIYK